MTGARFHRIESITIHEGYNWRTMENDIAVVLLRTEDVLQYTVRRSGRPSRISADDPVGMLRLQSQMHIAQSSPLVDDVVRLAGWVHERHWIVGTAPPHSFLKKGWSVLSDATSCADAMRMTGMAATGNTVCAVSPGGCTLNAGGPLFRVAFKDVPVTTDGLVERVQIWEQVGILSFSNRRAGCGSATFPSMYTDVTKYRTWLADVMSQTHRSWSYPLGAEVGESPCARVMVLCSSLA
jgi:secreted trypsin-like serine protease